MDLEEGPLWLGALKRLQCRNPNLDASLDRKALWDARDDDLAGSGDSYVLEILVLGQEHEIGLRGESLNDLSVCNPSASEQDVLGVMTSVTQADVQA